MARLGPCMNDHVSSVALIGSFRKHYAAVEQASSCFVAAGLEVLNPRGKEIVKTDIPFVRFDSDPSTWSDEMIQTVALHRILKADFVYVVAPAGYVGRTTCYEIGRIVQSEHPIYFGERPRDLPLAIPEAHICRVDAIADRIAKGTFEPQQLHLDMTDSIGDLERDLANGHFRDI